MKFAARFGFFALSICLVTACGKFSAESTSPSVAGTSTQESKTDGTATSPVATPVTPWTEEKSTQLEVDIKTLEASTPDETWTSEKIAAYDIVLVRTEATLASYSADIAKVDETLPAKIMDLTKKRRALVNAIRKFLDIEASSYDI